MAKEKDSNELKTVSSIGKNGKKKTWLPESDSTKHRKREWRISKAEIMTILICFHFNSFLNFVLTKANVDAKDKNVFDRLTDNVFGKL